MLQDEDRGPLTVEDVITNLNITEEAYKRRVIEEKSSYLGEGVSPKEMTRRFDNIILMEKAMGR